MQTAQTAASTSNPNKKEKKEDTNFFWNSLSLQDVDQKEKENENENTSTSTSTIHEGNAIQKTKNPLSSSKEKFFGGKKKVKKKSGGITDEQMQQEAQGVAEKAATSFGFGLTMYATWIGITTLLIFNIITAFRFLGTIRSLVQSVRKLATDESFTILSVIFAIIQFFIITALFVWFQIVCKKCSRDIYNSALASCIQIRGALNKKGTQNKAKKEKRFHRIKKEKIEKDQKANVTKEANLFWDALVSI